MVAILPLLGLIGVLGLLALLQAHHPGETRDVDRTLAAVARVGGLLVLFLALSQVFALTRP